MRNISFPQYFLSFLRTFCHFLSNLELSSAKSFSMEESKICRLEKGKFILPPHPPFPEGCKSFWSFYPSGLVFTCLQYKPFEKSVGGKGEIAHSVSYPFGKL